MNELSLIDALFGDEDMALASFPVLPSCSMAISTPCSTAPSVDVKETKDAYIIDMDVPGMSEKDIALDLDGKVLSIHSQKNDSTEEKSSEDKKAEESKWLLRERFTPDFKRQFELPEDIDEEAIRACFKNGVLTVTIPRKAPVASSKKITIAAA